MQGQVQEFLLTRDWRSETLTMPDVAGQGSLGSAQAFKQYLGVGSQHILAGADHLAFLFGLILLPSGWREMAWLITGFTLGHSVSLVLAVLGVAQPNGVMVEALIGFTIALVAIEAAGERSGQLPRRPLVVCAVPAVGAARMVGDGAVENGRRHPGCRAFLTGLPADCQADEKSRRFSPVGDIHIWNVPRFWFCRRLVGDRLSGLAVGICTAGLQPGGGTGAGGCADCGHYRNTAGESLCHATLATAGC